MYLTEASTAMTHTHTHSHAHAHTHTHRAIAAFSRGFFCLCFIHASFIFRMTAVNKHLRKSQQMDHGGWWWAKHGF